MQKIKNSFDQKKATEIHVTSRILTILMQKSSDKKNLFNPIRMLAIAECIMKKPKF